MAEKQRSNEWYTPAKYIEAAREVMGGIDLDPASCELANQTVKASRFYTKEDDGLSKEWYGRVWLNPPYGRHPSNGHSNIGLFTQKLIDEYEMGHIQQGILLSTSRTDTSWFRLLWNYPICFTDHGVQFHQTLDRSRKLAAHFHGTIFVYLGPNEHKFTNTFSQFGRIARAIDTPRRVEKPIPLWDVERIYA